MSQPHAPPPISIAPPTNPWEGPERRVSLPALSVEVSKLKDDMSGVAGSVADLGTTVSGLVLQFSEFCNKYGDFLDETLRQKIKRDQRLEDLCSHLLKWAAVGVAGGVASALWFAAKIYFGVTHG